MITSAEEMALLRQRAESWIDREYPTLSAFDRKLWTAAYLRVDYKAGIDKADEAFAAEPEKKALFIEDWLRSKEEELRDRIEEQQAKKQKRRAELRDAALFASTRPQPRRTRPSEATKGATPNLLATIGLGVLGLTALAVIGVVKATVGATNLLSDLASGGDDDSGDSAAHYLESNIPR